MRTSTILRLGAVATASAVALSLGVGPATADEGQGTVTSFSAPTPAAIGSTLSPSSVGASSVSIPGLAVFNGVLTTYGTNYVPASFYFAGNPSFGGSLHVYSRLIVNGVDRGEAELVRFTNGTQGVAVPSAVGPGVAQLGSTRVTNGSSSEPVNAPASNPFKLQLGIYPQGKLSIHRKGKKVTFTASKIRYFDAATGIYRPLKKVKLQYKSGSKWKTKKNIKLNSAGKGTYKIRTSTKRRYRILIPTTSVIKGNYTKQSKKI